jgi:hypothetical protein
VVQDDSMSARPKLNVLDNTFPKLSKFFVPYSDVDNSLWLVYLSSRYLGRMNKIMIQAQFDLQKSQNSHENFKF